MSSVRKLVANAAAKFVSVDTVHPLQGHRSPEQLTECGADAMMREVWKIFDIWTGLRSRRIWSDSDSDSHSGLQILTWTPTPTPLRLWPSKSYSIRKRAIWCSYSLDFPFDCVKTVNAAMQHPFALNADAAGRGHCRFLWMCSVWQSLKVLS